MVFELPNEHLHGQKLTKKDVCMQRPWSKLYLMIPDYKCSITQVQRTKAKYSYCDYRTLL